MSVTVIHNGLPQHLNFLRDYARMIDKTVYFPELTEADLAQSKAVVIACRSDNDQLERHAAILRGFLDDGGLLALMGGDACRYYRSARHLRAVLDQFHLVHAAEPR